MCLNPTEILFDDIFEDLHRSEVIFLILTWCIYKLLGIVFKVATIVKATCMQFSYLGIIHMLYINFKMHLTKNICTSTQTHNHNDLGSLCKAGI